MKMYITINEFLSLIIVLAISTSCRNNSQEQKEFSKLTSPTDESFMKSTIEEKSYNFVSTKTDLGVVAQYNGVNSIVITGGSKSLSIQISIFKYNPTGKFKEGVYKIGENSDVEKSVGSMILIKNGVMFTSGVSCPRTDGTLTITKITDSFVEGTFSFNTKELSQCLKESAKFLPITNGSFRAKMLPYPITR
jgi:hypothetical protein